MDKSLKFFTDISNTITNNTDGITGLKTQSVEGKVNINYTDPNDPTKIVRSEQKKYNFNALLSEQNPNTYINYLYNLSSLYATIHPIPVNIVSDVLFNKLSGCVFPPGHHKVKYVFMKFIPTCVFSTNSNII
jgi:hypothetical protein